jgi:hypothetical protein
LCLDTSIEVTKRLNAAYYHHKKLYALCRRIKKLDVPEKSKPIDTFTGDEVRWREIVYIEYENVLFFL